MLRRAVRQPLHSAKHVAHFGLELKNVLLGKSSLAPESDDRRFNDPAWSNNPLYRRYLQTYGLAQRAAGLDRQQRPVTPDISRASSSST